MSLSSLDRVFIRQHLNRIFKHINRIIATKEPDETPEQIIDDVLGYLEVSKEYLETIWERYLVEYMGSGKYVVAFFMKDIKTPMSLTIEFKGVSDDLCHDWVKEGF